MDRQGRLPDLVDSRLANANPRTTPTRCPTHHTIHIGSAFSARQGVCRLKRTQFELAGNNLGTSSQGVRFTGQWLPPLEKQDGLLLIITFLAPGLVSRSAASSLWSRSPGAGCHLRLAAVRRMDCPS